MNEPTDAASLRDEREVHPDPGTASQFGDAERARARALRDVLAPVADAMGLELVHVQWSQSGRTRRLQVFIDKEGGVGLADCASMSPIFSNALDAAEAAETEPGPARPNEPGAGVLAGLLAAPYLLEVSSPGLDRPLSRLSHFQTQVGKRAKVRTISPLSPDSTQRNFHGRIQSVIPDSRHPEDQTQGLVVLHDEDSARDHRIPVAHIRNAHLVYEG